MAIPLIPTYRRTGLFVADGQQRDVDTETLCASCHRRPTTTASDLCGLCSIAASSREAEKDVVEEPRKPFKPHGRKVYHPNERRYSR